MCKQKLLMMVSALFLIALPLANAHIIDNFNRADSGTLGTASNGNTWAEFNENAGDHYDILSNQLRSYQEDDSTSYATLGLALAVNITNDTITLHNFKDNTGGFKTNCVGFYDDKGTLGYDFGFDGTGTTDSFKDNGVTDVIFKFAGDPPPLINITLYFDFDNGKVIFENSSINNFTRSMITAVKNITTIRLMSGLIGAGTFDINEITSNHTIALPPADTCTIAASGDHIVKDNCTWSTPQNVPANLIFRDDAPLSIVLSSVLRFTGSNQYIVIDSPTTIDIRSGGSFGGT